MGSVSNSLTTNQIPPSPDPSQGKVFAGFGIPGFQEVAPMP